MVQSNWLIEAANTNCGGIDGELVTLLNELLESDKLTHKDSLIPVILSYAARNELWPSLVTTLSNGRHCIGPVEYGNVWMPALAFNDILIPAYSAKGHKGVQQRFFSKLLEGDGAFLLQLSDILGSGGAKSFTTDFSAQIILHSNLFKEEAFKALRNIIMTKVLDDWNFRKAFINALKSVGVLKFRQKLNELVHIEMTPQGIEGSCELLVFDQLYKITLPAFQDKTSGEIVEMVHLLVIKRVFDTSPYSWM